MNTQLIHKSPHPAEHSQTLVPRLALVVLCCLAVHCGGGNNNPDGGNADGAVTGITRITGAFAPIASASDLSFRGVWGNSPSDIYVVGVTTLKTYNGMRFNTTAREETFAAVSGAMGGEAVVVGGLMGMAGGGDTGRGAIVQRNAAAWVDRVPPAMTTQLQSVYVASSTAAWAVGTNTILRFSGTNWTNGWMGAGMPGDLYAVHGTSATDVWATGEKTQHWDGMTWTTVDVGTTDYFLSAFAVNPTDVWIAGTGGIARHFTGGVWVNFPTGTGKSIYGLWARATNDVWAVGEAGTIVHYNGQAWENASSGTMNNLRSIWGFANGEMFVVGERGTVLKYTP